MNMSDSDSGTELDQLAELRNFSSDQKANRFQVSGWDDDTDEGITEEREPDDETARDFLQAAEDGKEVEVLKFLSKNKDLLKVQDKDGYTALHRASYNNQQKVVKVLLDMGADLSAKTDDDWQPLHSACKWNSLECAELLIAYGADVNATSKGGVTPLHLAAGHCEAVAIIQMILLHPNLVHGAVDQAGDTPTDIAIRTGPNGYLFEPEESCFL